MSKANKTIDGIEYVVSCTACEMLGISLSSLKKLRYEGNIGYYQLNERCVLYNLTDIDNIRRSKHVMSKKDESVNVVEMNDGNLLFQGQVFVKDLTVAMNMGITMESLIRMPNIRSITGRDGRRYFHKKDVERLFIEGKRQTKGKDVLKG